MPIAIQRILLVGRARPDTCRVVPSDAIHSDVGQEGSMVGWDCVIEWLNAAITESVSHHVSEERIERFVSLSLSLNKAIRPRGKI
eukprot:6187105-Pleurochrysis_carterae.AAC.1